MVKSSPYFMTTKGNTVTALFHPTQTKRALFFVFIDMFIIASAVLISFALRFDWSIPLVHQHSIIFVVILFLMVKIPLLGYVNIYKVPWRYFTVKDFGIIVTANTIGTLLLGLIIIIGWGTLFTPFPRSIVFIEFFLTTFGMLALRSSKRLALEYFNKSGIGEPTLIIGANDDAEATVRMLRRTTTGFNPVAFMDHLSPKIGMQIQGLPIFPLTSKPPIEAVCAIITHNDLEPDDLDALFEKLHSWGITTIKKISPIQDASSCVELSDINIEDLLARHPKDLDTASIASFIEGKKILITGAGGSIGSELVRQCLHFNAQHIVALDHSEFNLYALLETLNDPTRLTPVMQSVLDLDALHTLFKNNTFDAVLHAAAYKHVPLTEGNIKETINNNIVGTKNVIDLSLLYNVKKFLLISTDKAVRPTNVMGTTKRICELYAQNINIHKNYPTEIVAVRFGNVLGSSGSVIPKFKSQIAQGGPLTITHPEITRYFMLIPEACALVLQAASIGKGGELFILDMGKPVKIVDLAHKMIELSGRKDIAINFTGLRPGEKLYEELLIDETEEKTRYESIMIAKPTPYDISLLQDQITQLLITDHPKELLMKIVPEAKLTLTLNN